MADKKFWEEKMAYEKMMSDEVTRVMEIMDDHGYEFCDHVDFEFAHQFVKVETQHEGRIISWIWAVSKRENFKAVLKWFCNHTKFYGVTAIMSNDEAPDPILGQKPRRIPTFYNANDVEHCYNEYFGW